MRKFVTIIYGSLSLSFLIKQYVFGGIVYAIMLQAFKAGQAPTGMLIFLTLSLILYPFSMFVCESISDTLMGNWIIPIPAMLLLILIPLKIIAMFMLAVLIAPIGMAYLYFTRRHSYSEHQESDEI